MTITDGVVRTRGSAPAPVIGARALLDESEQLWSTDVRGALHATPSLVEQHRRWLVRDALAAYERLRAAQAPSSDPATVFLRWPACTVVALARPGGIQPMEYATVDIPADRWLAGWTQACARLGLAAPPSGVARDPVLALDPERGALVIAYGNAPGTTVTAAGGRPCVLDGDRWVVVRATPAVTCESVGEAHRLRVVDMADPLLVFTPDGTLMPFDQPLPPGEAWIVHYGRPADGWCEGEVQILEHRPPPVGWSRWWLARVDLSAVTAVRSAVQHGPGPRFGPWHIVTAGDQRGSAVLEFGPPLSGVTGPDGEPVYPSPPRLVLAGGSARWTVSVGAVGSAGTSSVSARGEETVVLGEGLPRPLLGRYQVRAAGGGKPVVATFTVAEGVELAPSCRVRVLSPQGGLYSARITVSTPAGVHARPAVVKLGAHERDGTLALRGSRTLELRVALPHCAVRERSAAGPGPWQITSRTVDLTDATGGRWLDIHLPASLRQALASAPTLVALDSSGSEVQRVQGARVGRTDVERFRLDQLADTVRRHGILRLRLDLPGQKTFVATVGGPRPVEPPRVRDTGTARPQPPRADVLAVRHESVAVIRSGLAARDLRRVADPVAVRTLWGTAPLRALLLTSPLLPYLADTEGWDLAELDDDERLLLGEVTARCSPPALAVLAGAPLVPAVRTVDALSPDGRTLAEPHRLDLGSADAELIVACRAVIPPDLMGTSDAPLVCAVLARAAAHGDRAAATIEQRIRPAWLRMAHRAPNLIGNDLVIAEFLITRPRAAAAGPARRVP